MTYDRSWIVWALRLIAYAVCAVVTTVQWTSVAGHQANGSGSLDGIQDLTGVKPFVYRRLAADASYGLWKAVPARVWEAAAGRIDRSAFLTERVHRVAWQRSMYARLLALTVVVAGGVFGFTLVMHAVIGHLYESAPGVRTLIVLALTIMLSGGAGSHTIWQNYPYDLPNAACFWLLMLCVMRGSWLAIPAAALAAYSKETSLLAVMATPLIWPEQSPRGRAGRWTITAVSAIVYVVIQVLIRRYARDAVVGQYAFLPSNVLELIRGASWSSFSVLFVAGLLAARWGTLPWQLRRCLFMPLVLFAASMFKGWVTELRAYLEVMPLIALLLLQVLFGEWRRPDWFRPRTVRPGEDENRQTAPLRRGGHGVQ